MKERQLYNLQILSKLLEEIAKNPDYRFIQVLWKMGLITRKYNMDGTYEIEDRFYEEPDETLLRISQSNKGNKYE